MSKSAPLNGDSLLHFSQYNNLRDDLLDPQTGHDHLGLGRAVARLASGTADSSGVAGAAGQVMVCSAPPCLLFSDGADWHAVSVHGHGHAQGDVAGLAGDLAGKAAADHHHAAGDVDSGQLALAQGGTGADLSATGGSGMVLKQSGAGAAVSVDYLNTADLPTVSLVSRVFRDSGNLTATATAYEDVPGATRTFEGESGDFYVSFSCSCSLSVKGKKFWFKLVRDDDALYDHVVCLTAPEAGYIVPVNLSHYFGWSSQNSHTFKVQWKVEEGEATLYADGADGTLAFSVTELLR